MGNTYLFHLFPLRARFIPTCVGIHQHASALASCFRFIPTCVGNTLPFLSVSFVPPVHPHVCGEYVDTRELETVLRFIPTCVGNTNACSRVSPNDRGSSPRVWGIRLGDAIQALCGRFIPTCVGNTISEVEKSNASAVHPHVCGEYEDNRNNQAMDCGSSPRVWGIHLSKRYRYIFFRFIPTCVGNTYR